MNTDDSINIGAFDANAKPNASSQKLQDLYQKKADAQQAVNDSKNEHSDKQSAINDRKAELISSRQSDNKTDDSQKQYAEAKQQYDQKNSEKNSAANELNQIQQQSSAKDQEISANAQQTQQVTADLNAARSELASLTPPTPPSGEDKDAQANYESQKAAYEERKAAIQAKIDAKTAEQQQLQAKAQQLQSAKDQLARQQQTKEHAVAQLDGELQKLQAEMDKCEQKMSADDPELKKTIEEDQQLQTLQDEEQQAQQEIDTKQSELDAIQTEIDQAEAEDSTLQAARSDTAHNQLETTAKAAGYDVEASAAAAQETAAREAYGKSYDQLSDEEKISIESKVDGEVTLELMDKARKVLETDPDNSAAQSVLEKGGKDLEARQNWAELNLNYSIDSLPEELQNAAVTVIETARAKAEATDEDPEAASLEALTNYLNESTNRDDISGEDKSAVRVTLTAARTYADTIIKGQTCKDITAAANINLDKTAAENADNLKQYNSQKTAAEQDLTKLERQVSDAHSLVNDRKQEIIETNFKDDPQYNELNDSYQASSDACDNAQTARDDAEKSMINSIKEKNNLAQAMELNAQALTQNATDLQDTQNELNNLQEPVKPAGNYMNAQTFYETQLKTYELTKKSLENKQKQLEQQKRDLQIAEVQYKKSQAELEKRIPEQAEELKHCEVNLRNSQAEKNNAQQAIDDYCKFENDDTYQSLQQNYEHLCNMQDKKNAEVQYLDAKITATETNQQIQEASQKAGCDITMSMVMSQNAVAQERYSKDYNELTQEEKRAIQDTIDSTTTVSLMEQAREILKTDPNNAAAQEILQKGMINLDAGKDAVYALLAQQLTDLPADLQHDIRQVLADGTAIIGSEHIDNPQVFLAEALSDYIADCTQSETVNSEERTVLQNILNTTNSYKHAEQNSQHGRQTCNESMESLADSELWKMKNQMAHGLGIDVNDIIVLSATENNNNIDIVPKADGGLKVTIDGEIHMYSPEEAKRLLIDGGRNRDTIRVNDENHVQDGHTIYHHISGVTGPDTTDYVPGVTVDLHIYGGDGIDTIVGGSGNDLIYGGAGGDSIDGGKGYNFMDGGDDDDHINGKKGDANIVFGGNGNDWLYGGRGNDIMLGGAGDDHMRAGRGDDIAFGEDGKDSLNLGRGYDYADGGNDNDTIDTGDGGGYYEGGSGDDSIHVRWGSNSTIHDTQGKDHYVTEEGKVEIYDFDEYTLSKEGSYKAQVIEHKNAKEDKNTDTYAEVPDNNANSDAEQLEQQAEAISVTAENETMDFSEKPAETKEKDVQGTDVIQMTVKIADKSHSSQKKVEKAFKKAEATASNGSNAKADAHHSAASADSDTAKLTLHDDNNTKHLDDHQKVDAGLSMTQMLLNINNGDNWEASTDLADMISTVSADGSKTGDYADKYSNFYGFLSNLGDLMNADNDIDAAAAAGSLTSDTASILEYIDKIPQEYRDKIGIGGASLSTIADVLKASKSLEEGDRFSFIKNTLNAIADGSGTIAAVSAYTGNEGVALGAEIVSGTATVTGTLWETIYESDIYE